MKQYTGTRVTRKELFTLDVDFINEILTTETSHDHPIIQDDHGTYRWLGDPLISEMFNRGQIDLNQIMVPGRIKPIVGIHPEVEPDKILKNDTLIRELYRRLGYGLWGYWEVFYWEANNPNSDKYIDKAPVFQYPTHL